MQYQWNSYSNYDYLLLLAAGIDVLLENGTTTTLTLSPSVTTANFEVEALCDNLVEGNDQRCTLVFMNNITVRPESVRDSLDLPVALDSRTTVLEIAECPGEGEFLPILSQLKIVHILCSIAQMYKK